MFNIGLKRLSLSILLLTLAVSRVSGGDETLKIGALEEGDTLEEEDHKVSGDMVKFGENIIIAPGKKVDGDVVAIGGSITVRGYVDGDVVAVGGSLEVDSTGEITGDAVAVGGSVEKKEGGRIEGDEVSVGIPGFSMPFQSAFGKPWFQKPPLLKRTFSLIGKVVRTGILMTIALLLVIFLPKPLTRMENTVRNKFFATLGLGLLGEILICPLLVALCVSIIGIPFVPVAILALIAGLIFGYAGISLLLGRTFVERMNYRSTSALTAVIFGVILIELVSLLGRIIGLGGGVFGGMGIFVGILGFLITYIAWTLGFGGVLLTRFGTREPYIPSVVKSSES